jgi:hypothetical protein
MSYIQTQPPVSAANLMSLIGSINPASANAFDGVVLSNLIRVCYECALKTGELVRLSIGDVAQKGVVGNVMRVDDVDVPLSTIAKQILQNHMHHLKMSGYKMYPTSPLFPTKIKSRYYERRLNAHFKKITIAEITLEQVRQAGVCDFYENLKVNQLSPAECLRKTAEFARISAKHTEFLLVGRIQPTGTKDDPYFKRLGEISRLEGKLLISGITANRREIKMFRRDIGADKELSAQDKKNLNLFLDDSIRNTPKYRRLRPARIPELGHIYLIDRMDKAFAETKKDTNEE